MSVGPARQPRRSHERAIGRVASELLKSPVAGSHLLNETPNALRVAFEYPGANPSFCYQGSLAGALRSPRAVLVEGGCRYVSDAVAHHVADLALANKDQEFPGRDAESSRCLADSQWGIRHLDLRRDRRTQVYG